MINADCLCGLVVRVPGYRSRGLCSIPATTRFSEEVMGLEQGQLQSRKPKLWP
jgi:hypothetical protein